MAGMEIKTRFAPGDTCFVPGYKELHRTTVDLVKTVSVSGRTGEYVAVRPKVCGSEIFKAEDVLTQSEYVLLCAAACVKEIQWPMEIEK